MYSYYLSKDKVDNRDFLFNKSASNVIKLPVSVDLRNLCPSVYDQGEEGSCTANAGVAARIMLMANKTLQLSRAFLYYEERKIEGTTTRDAGATLRDCCKAILSYGICEESYMPYLTTSITTPPSATAISNAKKYLINSYTRLNTLTDVKTSLSTNKPVIIGMIVYESMESNAVAKTGMLPMPALTEQELGGHAVLVVGYDDSKNYLIVRNSWGATWGDKGYFYMPYNYFNQYTMDKWILS